MKGACNAAGPEWLANAHLADVGDNETQKVYAPTEQLNPLRVKTVRNVYPAQMFAITVSLFFLFQMRGQ